MSTLSNAEAALERMTASPNPKERAKANRALAALRAPDAPPAPPRRASALASNSFHSEALARIEDIERRLVAGMRREARDKAAAEAARVDTGLTAAEAAAMDRGMGLMAASSGVVRRGARLILGAPAMARSELPMHGQAEAEYRHPPTPEPAGGLHSPVGTEEASALTREQSADLDRGMGMTASTSKVTKRGAKLILGV